METTSACPFHTAAQDKPMRFPMERRPLAPPPEYEQLRGEFPISRVTMPDGSPAWLVTRYEDVRAILCSRAFSNTPTAPGYPMVSPVRASILLKEDPQAYPLLRLDPPDHTKFRRMLARDFAQANVETMRPFIEQTVDALLDEMSHHDGPVDFVEAFAMALPSAMIAHILGVPAEDTEYFTTRTKAKFNLKAPPEDAVRASAEIRAFLEALVDKRMQAPADDLISRLVHEQVVPGHMTHQQCLATLQLLLEAGHETTGNMIALGTLSLMMHPDQKRELVANPSLVPSAVEEMLRFHTVGHLSGARAALSDVTVGGVHIAKGDGVLCMMAAANRDPAVFGNPDEFDIHRNDGPHVAFGFGVHLCLGQPLARQELQIVFSKLFQRFPGLRLAVPFEALTFQPDGFTYGLEDLPVTW